MGYKILSQGVLDGACFIYSIMNAYKTLVNSEMDIYDFMRLKPDEKSGKQKWEYLIKICPQTTDVLSGLGFIDSILRMEILNSEKVISNQYDNFIRTAFNVLSDSDNEFVVSNIGLEVIDKFIFLDSVIILPIVKGIKTVIGNEIGNHFICINGRTDDQMHVICSYTIHAVLKEAYNEMFDSKCRRYFNNMIRIEDINADNLEKGINTIYKVQRLIK